MSFRIHVPLDVRLARLRGSQEVFFLAGVFFLPFGKSVSEIAFAVSLCLWVIQKLLGRQPLIRLGPCNLSYLIFLLVALISMTQAAPDQIHTAWRGFFKWLKYFGIFFMAAEFYDEPARVKRLLGVFLASMAAVCANGLVQMWRGTDLIKGYSIDYPGRYTRVQSSFGSPNDLACFLLVALPLSFGAWLRKSVWSARSADWAVLTGLFFFVFVLTFSRGAYLALGLALILYFLAKRKFLPLLILGLFGILFISSSSYTRYNFAGSLRLKDVTVGQRIQLWQSTVELIKTHPFFGNGINLHSQKILRFARPGQHFAGYSHNCYLQMAGEVGLAGLAVFLLPIGWILVKIKTGRRRAEPPESRDLLWIGLAAYLIQSAFDTNFYALQTAYLFWIFWGVLAGLSIGPRLKAAR